MEKKFIPFNKWLTESEELDTKAFEAMGYEEQSGLMLKYNESMVDTFNKAEEALRASELKSDELNNELNSLRNEYTQFMQKSTEDQIRMMNDNLRAFGVQVKAFTEGGGEPTNKKKSFGEQVKSALNQHKDKLEAIKSTPRNAKDNIFSFEVKDAGTMANATNISNGNVPVEDRLTGFDIVPSRRVKFLDVLSKRTTSSNLVSWVSQINKDGLAGVTGENQLKNQIDFDIAVNYEAVKKVTAFITVTTEMLDDIEWIESEIRTELMRELMKAAELQAYSGDGTGNNLNGINTVATTFAPGAFAANVDNANEVDVLRAAMDQIEIAEHDMPNFIFMYPSDLTALKFVKVDANDRRYVEALNEIASNKSLDGIPIITTTLIPQGEFLIGNFDLALLITKGDIGIEMGRNGDDFTNNRMTILAEWRGLTLVKDNNRTAFIKGDFTTAKASLETA